VRRALDNGVPDGLLAPEFAHKRSIIVFESTKLVFPSLGLGPKFRAGTVEAAFKAREVAQPIRAL
jgi:hypothetical protein